ANQSWKDSGDALVYPDGTLVKGPTATCELQGYVYDAWLRMAEIYDAVGDGARAADLRTKAATLFARFNEAFWDEATGFYAFALDGDKKKVLSVASNPGQCLWSGIVPPERAGRVVARLMQPDMWSGWGIRTLSADHPAYNPYSYQCGSVWPHDNGLIALGFKRYGYAAEACRIAHDVSTAGSFFMLDQLPELYAGLHRDKANFPVQYLGANVPQAWAAGSVFSLVQAILGFQPDAPRRMLYLDPVLPPWLSDLTLRDLRLGDQLFDIRFRRSGEETRFDVLKGDPAAVARREVVVWSALLKRTAEQPAAH
ncbi:MAG: amylo-alpha-1,6-glucosidase, partial [Bradyrhizobium sp.]